MNLKKIGEVFTSKFVGTGPSPYKKRIYRAAVFQRLRNTGLTHVFSLRKPFVVVNTAKLIFNLHINGPIPFFVQSLFKRGN